MIDDRAGVDPGQLCESVADLPVVLEQELGCEVRELQRPQDAELAPGKDETSRDNRSTATPGRCRRRRTVAGKAASSEHPPDDER